MGHNWFCANKISILQQFSNKWKSREMGAFSNLHEDYELVGASLWIPDFPGPPPDP